MQKCLRFSTLNASNRLCNQRFLEFNYVVANLPFSTFFGKKEQQEPMQRQRQKQQVCLLRQHQHPHHSNHLHYAYLQKAIKHSQF